MGIDGKKTKDGKKLIVWGYVLVIIASLYLIFEFTGQLETKGTAESILQMLVIFGGGGALLLYFGYKRKNTLALYTKVEKIVVHQNQTNSNSIANAVGITHSKLMVVLRKMLELGYFPNAYIDENLHELILSKQTQDFTNNKVQETVLKCHGCGGTNTIVVGKVAECEWCGTPIKQSENSIDAPVTVDSELRETGIKAEAKDLLKKILK